ncbi:cellulase family glycosylhydrolase [Micromonospora yasonensis]|uniref:cellulase family glycosylhydrolase n=1 Tax=Micromonospora yasonensis TaxID=1128667 RepID=UPI00222EF0F6|nr:cellulase family glycosylhydrolase [Micromonospora yasonensis]MCW3844154.1 cellulase family glycosylhydrolase [Micromonospora yasonensis]
MISIPRRSRRELLVGGAVGALALAATAVLPMTDAMAATGCAVTYTTSSWQGGFTATVTIQNLGDPVTNWTLGFTFPNSGQRVTQGWSATWQQSGSAVTARSLDYNGALSTGASTTIGFNGSWTTANPSPTSFTLNGTTCTGGTTTPPPSTTPPPTTPPPPTGTTPLAINGQLRVCGVNLCNQYGRPIQLRGMSTHGLQWFAHCYNDASLDALANDWQADLLRISMYVQEQGYETNPTGFTNQVNTLVDKAEARGMYALIDFHTLTPGDPMYNLDRAKTFFTAVSARNAAKKNVIYEITNEPNGVSWSTIRNYAEQVIPVIRANDPDAVIVVGTRGWSSLGVSEGGNSDEIVNNPVRADNIMYTFHFYAASHKDNYRNEVQRAASRIPLFVTEFGTVTYTGDGAVDTASSTAWLDLLDRLKISYANWTYSDAGEGSAAFKPNTCYGSTYAGTSVLTESGNFMRNRIRTPDNFPTS